MAQKVVNNLVKRTYRGHWGGTIQNAMVIVAFAIWNPPSNSGDPVSVLAKLNDKKLFKGSFGNQSPTEQTLQQIFAFTEAPLKELERDALHDLQFELNPQNSEEETYYTTELKYSIPMEEQYPRDAGLSVFYEIVDMEGKIMTKELTLGQTYRMNVYVSTARDRNNLIVKTPLPSGTEILDGTFVTSAQRPPQEKKEKHRRLWYYSSKQFIYDNHVLTAYEHFRQGYHKSRFLFRTTTAGRYPTPPVQAETMNQAEVFGRSGGSLFIIQ